MAKSPEAVTDAFTTLANPVRRYVLYTLAEQEGPSEFDSLATQVTAWRTASDPDDVDDATLADVRMDLHHVHLPKLADLGVITYKDNPGEISLADDTDSLESFLDPARRADFGTTAPTERL